jgi:hypothetical protein
MSIDESIDVRASTRTSQQTTRHVSDDEHHDAHVLSTWISFRGTVADGTKEWSRIRAKN